jgi:hypothetical protein
MRPVWPYLTPAITALYLGNQNPPKKIHMDLYGPLRLSFEMYIIALVSSNMIVLYTRSIHNRYFQAQRLALALALPHKNGSHSSGRITPAVMGQPAHLAITPHHPGP